MTDGRRWAREDFATDSEALAERLLGARLVSVTPSGRRVSGIIVETEAYKGAPDLASHAAGGRRTARNEAMYAKPGTAYVYFIYGMHFCFNVVCGDRGTPLAVLVRALRPDEGVGLMRRRRGSVATVRADRDLCRGPGRLCRALGIDRRHNGLDLVRGRRLFIEDGPGPPEAGAVARTARIGVAYAGEWALAPLRWVILDEKHVSGR